MDLSLCNFLLLKWITLIDAPNAIPNVSSTKAALYLFGWVGIDTRRFFADKAKPVFKPWVWIETISNIIIGFVIV